jgi:hypothetical protein
MGFPYFYIIEHQPSKTYYAGCKINSFADSSNLMTENGYKTTSRVVKKLIQKDGLSSFKILRIKHFLNSEQALSYETRFLQKVKAATNLKFLNLHNGGKNFVNKGGYKLKESTKNKMKKPKSKSTIDKQNQEKRKRGKKTYEKMVLTRKKKRLPWVSEQQKQKLKKFNDSYWNDENCKMQKDRMIEYYKKNPVSEETKNKKSEKLKGQNNPMFNKKHNESTKAKMKLAWQKRKENKKNN